MNPTEYDPAYLWTIALAAIKHCQAEQIDLTISQPDVMRDNAPLATGTTDHAYEAAIEAVSAELEYFL